MLPGGFAAPQHPPPATSRLLCTRPCRVLQTSNSVAAGDGLGSGPEDAGLDQTQTIAAAVFGVLGTLLKERWEDSRRYLALRLTMEHLQLLLILLQPHFGWRFHYENWWAACSASVWASVDPEQTACDCGIMFFILNKQLLFFQARHSSTATTLVEQHANRQLFCCWHSVVSALQYK